MVICSCQIKLCIICVQLIPQEVSVHISKSYCLASEFLFDNIDIICCFSILAQKLNSNSAYGRISFMKSLRHVLLHSVNSSSSIGKP